MATVTTEVPDKLSELVEQASVTEQLKHISQIEHRRHRSVANCFVNLLGGLIAYTWREKKPSLNIRLTEQLQLVF